jgi:hypothetical protein
VVTLAQVADALGRPLEQLQELDRRGLQLAFVSGSYETVVVRDRGAGTTVEATLDAVTGERVDPAELRRRDRELAERIGAALDAPLRDLLLRHPELPAVRAVVTRSGGAREAVHAAATVIVALAQEPDVTRIELAEDPEILDSS